MLKRLCWFVFLVGLVAALAGQSFGQRPATKEEWDAELRRRGFVPVAASSVPATIQPIVIGNWGQLGRALALQIAPLFIAENPGVSSEAASNDPTTTIMTCSEDMGSGKGKFTGHARVKKKSPPEIFSVSSKWHSHTGHIFNASIRDVSLDYTKVNNNFALEMSNFWTLVEHLSVIIEGIRYDYERATDYSKTCTRYPLWVG